MLSPLAHRCFRSSASLTLLFFFIHSRYLSRIRPSLAPLHASEPGYPQVEELEGRIVALRSQLAASEGRAQEGVRELSSAHSLLGQTQALLDGKNAELNQLRGELEALRAAAKVAGEREREAQAWREEVATLGADLARAAEVSGPRGRRKDGCGWNSASSTADGWWCRESREGAEGHSPTTCHCALPCERCCLSLVVLRTHLLTSMNANRYVACSEATKNVA